MVQRNFRRSTSNLKVGFHVEGKTDVTLLQAFIARILEIPLSDIDVLVLPSRTSYGHGNLLRTLSSACWHFWRENCDLAVIGRDNDDHPIEHQDSHKQTPDCHFCIYRSAIPELPLRQSANSEMKCVIAVPVQLIESWLLLGNSMAPIPERLPRKQAKHLFYGTDRSTHDIRQRTIDTKGLPYIQNVDLDKLAQRCPSFAFFRNQIT